MATSGITASVFERIAALDGTNYRSWAFALKMLLKAHELWEVIEDEEFEMLDEEAQLEEDGDPEVEEKGSTRPVEYCAGTKTLRTREHLQLYHGKGSLGLFEGIVRRERGAPVSFVVEVNWGSQVGGRSDDEGIHSRCTTNCGPIVRNGHEIGKGSHCRVHPQWIARRISLSGSQLGGAGANNLVRGFDGTVDG